MKGVLAPSAYRNVYAVPPHMGKHTCSNMSINTHNTDIE